LRTVSEQQLCGVHPHLEGINRSVIEIKRLRGSAYQALVAALEGCRTGLALLEKAGQPQPLETARAAVSRAEALVKQLGGR